jgi:hypothetical protein
MRGRAVSCASGDRCVRSPCGSPICLGRIAGDAFEGIAERALGRITEGASDHCHRGVLLTQCAFGKVHPPLGEIGQRRDTCDRSEVPTARHRLMSPVHRGSRSRSRRAARRWTRQKWRRERQVAATARRRCVPARSGRPCHGARPRTRSAQHGVLNHGSQQQHRQAYDQRRGDRSSEPPPSPANSQSNHRRKDATARSGADCRASRRGRRRSSALQSGLSGYFGNRSDTLVPTSFDRRNAADNPAGCRHSVYGEGRSNL